MTIPSNLLALALGFLAVLLAVALIAMGVPPLYGGPIAVYALAAVAFALGRRLGDVGPIAGNTMLVLGAIILGFTVAYGNVDLDVEGPRKGLGWLAFAAALVVPYALYGGYTVLAERRADRNRAQQQ